MIMKSLLIFFCALFFFSWQLVGAGLILVSQKEIDFGSYPSWEARQGTFLLRNTGNSDVVLKRVRSTCGCLTSEFTRTSLPPGVEYPLKVSIGANSVNGVFTKLIYLETDGHGQDYITLRLSGNAVPLVQVSPSKTVYMGTLFANRNYCQEFKLVPAAGNVRLVLMETEHSVPVQTHLEPKDGYYSLTVNFRPDDEKRFLTIVIWLEVLSPVEHPPLKITVRAKAVGAPP